MFRIRTLGLVYLWVFISAFSSFCVHSEI
jgi:hypothetical protein